MITLITARPMLSSDFSCRERSTTQLRELENSLSNNKFVPPIFKPSIFAAKVCVLCAKACCCVAKLCCNAPMLLSAVPIRVVAAFNARLVAASASART